MLSGVEHAVGNKVTFGVTLPVQGVEFERLKEFAQQCEKLGFDSVWCYDHFFPYDGTKPTQPFYECFTTLTALSMVTSRIRLGSLVACNNFRNPALVAKITSQIDVLSKGRFELGIGAGWNGKEFDAYGYEFNELNLRLERLEEAIQIINKMWMETSPSFEGKYYRIKNAVNEPKPVQKPHPPIWFGGSRKTILRLAAKYADGWNLGFYESNSPKGFAEKCAFLSKACKKYGRNPSDLRRSWTGLLILGRNEKELSEKVKRYGYLSMGYPSMFVTVDTCATEMRKFTQSGVTDFFIQICDPNDLNTLQILSEKIVPLFSS